MTLAEDKNAGCGAANVQVVLDNDMCIACGACIEVCHKKNIKPAYSDSRGCHEVAIVNAEGCAECHSPCTSVCPSVEINFAELLPELVSCDEPRLGKILSVDIGQSPTYAKNQRSSSGGVVRQLAAFAVENDMQVLCLTEEGRDYKNLSPELVGNLAQVERLPGSIYHSTNLNSTISTLRGSERPVILIAIPCQLAGFKKYAQKYEKQLLDKVYLTVGLICGWMYSDISIDFFSDWYGVKGEIEKISYRGETESGKLKIITSDGASRSYRRRGFKTIIEKLIYRASFSSDLNRLRCRVCMDHTNVLADISVGDAWLSRRNGVKDSIIVSRTKVGLDTILRLSESDDLLLEKGCVNDIIESQSANLVFGQTASTLLSDFRRRDLFSPQFTFGDIFHTGLSKCSIGFVDRLSITAEQYRRYLVRARFFKTYLFLYAAKFFSSELKLLAKRAARYLRKKIRRRI